MAKKVLLSGIFDLFMAAAANPEGVSAGVDPLASPTLQSTDRIVAPEIIGFIPMILVSEGYQGDTQPSDIFSLPLRFHRNGLITNQRDPLN
jgi:hypothetical protein